MTIDYTSVLEGFGFPIGWDGEGNIFGLDDLTPEQRALVDAATASYDPLTGVKSAACTRINAECAKRRTAGVPVQFPDGPGVVQTRSEIDLINVTGVSSAGLAATVSGDTPDLYFRDEANVNHALLPTQAVHFGAQVMQRLQAITKAGHDAKDAINADTVTTLEQIAAIEAAVAWPA